MAFIRKNYAIGKLASGISDVAIEVTLQIGHTLPTEAGEFRLTVWNDTVYPNPADDSGVEIMTAEYSGVPNVYDIVRAQESTFASSHSAGHAAALHYTAGMSEDDLLHVPNHNHAASAIISGVLIHERGGLEVDVHAYDGLVKISGGVTSEVIDNSFNWNTAFGWGDHSGLYDPAGTMTTHLGNFTHSDIVFNTTHRGSDGSDHIYIDQDVTQLSYPLFINVNTALSSMIMTGGEVSEGTNAGTIKVAALTAMLRTGAGATDPLVRISLAEQDNITLAAVDTFYNILLTYGDPCTISTSTDSGNGANIIGIGHCLKEIDGTRHYADAGLRLADGVRKLHKRASRLRAIEKDGGGVLVSDPDTRHLYITAGYFHRGINSYTFTVKDTSGSGPDTFDYYYWNPNGSVWVKDNNGGVHYTQIDNIQYNKTDSGTGLANLTVNKYTTNWVFVHPDDEHIIVVYGRTNGTLTTAENEKIPPSLPAIIDKMAVLLCKIIVRQGSDTLVFQNVEYFAFTPEITVDHNELQALQGGQVDQYYHLTNTQYTELTDSGETTLHSHAVAFTDLTDTPNSYDSVDIGKYVRVKADLTGLEFEDAQPLDAGLTSIAGLTFVAKSFVQVTAEDTYTYRSISQTKDDLGINTTDSPQFAHLIIPGPGTIHDGGGTDVTVAELKAAYSHSIDNSQAHSDYLINNGNDATSGALTVGSLITGGNIGIAAQADLIQLAANSTVISGYLEVNAGGINNAFKLVSTDAAVTIMMADSGTTADDPIAIVKTNNNLYFYSGDDGVEPISTSILQLKLDGNGQVTIYNTLYLKERAAALGDIAGRFQIWVKNTTPCELWCTDDAGTDHQIAFV